MATITELKEHLEKGGKIRRPCWGKGTYIYLDGDDTLTSQCEIYYCNKQLLLDDWEVYEEPFKIMHTGLYKTRAGKKAFVSFIGKADCEFYGVINGEKRLRFWYKNGKIWKFEESPKDIVAEWED